MELPGLPVGLAGVAYAISPVGQIVGVATEIGSDLIVMGSHGRKGWFRWFTSSVIENVIRKAPCSVLVAKPAPNSG